MEVVMARTYAGILGALACFLLIIRGLFLDLPANHVLTSGLIVFLIFSFTGFCIGYIADKSMQETQESCFKEKMSGLQVAIASKSFSTRDKSV